MKAAAESARAELNAAKAQADVARNETGYAVLLADADGVVVETLAEPGQVVSAGQVVVRVAHAGRREAVIELPETLRPAIGSTGRATLVWKRADGPCETAPVVGRRKPSDSNVRGSVRAGGPSGRRAAGLDHLDPDLERRGPPRRCRYRSARSSMRARDRAYGWSKGRRLGSRGVPCKSPASATKRRRSSATSRRAIASSRSARICCTKASTCDSRSARPQHAWP